MNQDAQSDKKKECDQSFFSRFRSWVVLLSFYEAIGDPPIMLQKLMKMHLWLMLRHMLVFVSVSEIINIYQMM